MITLLVTFLVSHLGGIITVVGAVAAGAGLWFHGKSMGTAQGVAETTATLQPQLDKAKTDAAVAQGQAAAQTQLAATAKTAAVNQAQADAIPDADLAAELAKQGALRDPSK